MFVMLADCQKQKQTQAYCLCLYPGGINEYLCGRSNWSEGAGRFVDLRKTGYDRTAQVMPYTEESVDGLS